MNPVQQFEIEIAEFYGSPYAVTTDCCTHAIELCLRYKQIKKTACPTHTYLSIPMTLEKLGIEWDWDDSNWTDYYYLKDTNIIDAAVLWREKSFISETLMCLSFQFKKHLSLSRGGAILCNNLEEFYTLKKMSQDGRVPQVPWSQQDIDVLGYHYYMTFETAELGLAKLPEAKITPARTWTQGDYPYLPNMTVFKK